MILLKEWVNATELELFHCFLALLEKLPLFFSTLIQQEPGTTLIPTLKTGVLPLQQDMCLHWLATSVVCFNDIKTAILLSLHWMKDIQ